MTDYYQPTLVTAGYAGDPFTITRANNTTAYVASGVWGGKVTFTVPNIPNAVLINSLTLTHIISRDSTSVAMIEYLFDGAIGYNPADGDLIAVPDADMAKLLTVATPGFSMTNGNSNVAPPFNTTAATTAARLLLGNNSAITKANSSPFIAGDTITVLFKVIAAYTPLALEKITVYPFWSYSLVPS